MHFQNSVINFRTVVSTYSQIHLKRQIITISKFRVKVLCNFSGQLKSLPQPPEVQFLIEWCIEKSI